MVKKILIVDDYADNRCLMKFLIESYGYQVLEAVNGQEAVDTVKFNRPDLILMDMAMPVMNGLTATETIREFEDRSELPIIAVSAYGHSYYKQAIEAGCDDLIKKPIDFVMIGSMLNQYLAR